MDPDVFEQLLEEVRNSDRLFQAFDQRTDEEDIPDSGQPAGAPQQAGQGVVGQTYR